MNARMTLKIRLGPFVTFEIDGESCTDIADALEGFERLNERVDAMCSDLIERVYPDGVPDGVPNEQFGGESSTTPEKSAADKRTPDKRAPDERKGAKP